MKTRMLPGPGRGMRVGIEIRTLAGRLTAAVGDWIIRNARGGIATCRHKDFTEVYEPDDEPGETPRAG